MPKIAENRPLFVLDHLEDPQNFGVVLRVAEAGSWGSYSCRSVACPHGSQDRRCTEYVRARVTNLVRTLEYLTVGYRSGCRRPANTEVDLFTRCVIGSGKCGRLVRIPVIFWLEYPCRLNFECCCGCFHRFQVKVDAPPLHLISEYLT